VFNDLLRDPAIAESLFLSESAVKKHVSAIFYKLGLSGERHVHRRVAAVLALVREAGAGDGAEALRPPSELQEGG
jgi:DNA-binding NarL/FixJ family response regulator